mmetsp:Transcript_25099/g.59635  ORF Transcript_25099/g.59635 Transcript_25099/m.59635 type:complete len:84 (+) Transcript_25099:1430-1681(+)
MRSRAHTHTHTHTFIPIGKVKTNNIDAYDEERSEYWRNIVGHLFSESLSTIPSRESPIERKKKDDPSLSRLKSPPTLLLLSYK